MQKKIILPLAAFVLVGLLGVGALTVAAHDGNGQTTIVERIAKRFNLNEAEVKAVFEEDHAARDVAMQEKMGNRLNQAVADGTLTETQKQLIEAKMAELKNQHKDFTERLKDMTPDQRHDAMETHRTELEDWAKTNGIDLTYLGIGFHKGGHHGAKGPHVGMKQVFID